MTAAVSPPGDSSRMPCTPTFAPRDASRSEKPRPIPRAPPVTIATFPASGFAASDIAPVRSYRRALRGRFPSPPNARGGFTVRPRTALPRGKGPWSGARGGPGDADKCQIDLWSTGRKGRAGFMPIDSCSGVTAGRAGRVRARPRLSFWAKMMSPAPAPAACWGSGRDKRTGTSGSTLCTAYSWGTAQRQLPGQRRARQQPPDMSGR